MLQRVVKGGDVREVPDTLDDALAEIERLILARVESMNEDEVQRLLA